MMPSENDIYLTISLMEIIGAILYCHHMCEVIAEAEEMCCLYLKLQLWCIYERHVTLTNGKRST